MRTTGTALLGLLAIVVGVPANAAALAPARVDTLSLPALHGVPAELDVNEAGDAVAVRLVGSRKVQVATRVGRGTWSAPARVSRRTGYGISAALDRAGRATVVWTKYPREAAPRISVVQSVLLPALR